MEEHVAAIWDTKNAIQDEGDSTMKVLASIESILDTDNMIVYKAAWDGTPMWESGVHVSDCTEDWWKSISYEDAIAVDKANHEQESK